MNVAADVTIGMTIRNLGDFLNNEIRTRNVSARKFAELCGVSHGVIDKFLDYGYKDVGYPSVDFLLKLAKATGADICYLMALVDPESVKDVDVETRVLTEAIRKLPEESQRIIRGFITNEISRNPD